VAVFAGHQRIVSYLLEKGASATIKCFDGRTASEMNPELKHLFQESCGEIVPKSLTGSFRRRRSSGSCPPIYVGRNRMDGGRFGSLRIRRKRARTITNPWLFGKPKNSPHADRMCASMPLSESMGDLLF